MKHKTDIERRVEEALNSLDGITRASANAWLYTRVKGKMLQDAKKPWERLASFLARPAVAIAGLVLILMVNAAILLKSDATELASTEEPRPQVDSESLIASSSSFDYEKLVQP